MKRNNKLLLSILNFKTCKMMKINFLFICVCMSFFFISCEKDDHNECHECHIAIMEECCATEPGGECCSDDHDHGEHAVDIGEFCGDDLANVEANGWIATQSIMHDGKEEFSEGDTVPASMIHCEEHADH